MFSEVSVRPHLRGGRGCPIPGQYGGGTPFPDLDRGVPHPRSGRERGVTHPRSGWGVPPSQVRMVGGTLDTPTQDCMGYPLSKTGWGTLPPPFKTGSDNLPPSRSGWGTTRPPSGDRAAYRALATWWAACLLRSHRRTFLSEEIFWLFVLEVVSFSLCG